MTHLRDARLNKALEFAPDQAQAPAKSVGDAIQFEALRALQPMVAKPPMKPPPGHWARIKAWWLPADHMPWNAALASLLLASLVTLVWRGEDTPGAEPEAPPAPPVAAAPSATPTPEPAPAEPKSAPRPRADAARESPTAPVVRARPPVTADAAVADAASPAQFQAQVPVPAAPPAVVTPPITSSTPAEAVANAPQPSALRAAPAAKTGQSLARAESSGALASPKTGAAAEAWTALRITPAGAASGVLRSPSPAWVGLVRRLLAVAVTPAALEGEPTLEIELLQGDVPLGRLALAGPWVRWTPTGGTSRTGQADAALLRELGALVAADPVTPPDSAR